MEEGAQEMSSAESEIFAQERIQPKERGGVTGGGSFSLCEGCKGREPVGKAKKRGPLHRAELRGSVGLWPGAAAGAAQKPQLMLGPCGQWPASSRDGPQVSLAAQEKAGRPP